MAGTPGKVEVALTPQVQERLDQLESRFDAALAEQRRIIDRQQARLQHIRDICQEAAQDVEIMETTGTQVEFILAIIRGEHDA